MLALAEPLTRSHRCVLPDQRGSGGSRVDAEDDLLGLHVDRLIEDIEALRVELGEERLRLVGWSWGAVLALMYGAVHPQRIERIAAIAPGPIPMELVEVYRANLLRPLNAEERARYVQLAEDMDQALHVGDAVAFRALNRELVILSSRVWFFSPEKAADFVDSYLDLAGDPYNAARVNRTILSSLGEFPAWDRMGAWEAPTLVVYGYQDFEPITQAHTIQEWVPQTRIVFINECGHYPWLEQPGRLYHELQNFFSAHPANEA
jgi:proline iminopeptidase